MKKRVLNNPRARRMLDLVNYNCSPDGIQPSSPIMRAEDDVETDKITSRIDQCFIKIQHEQTLCNLSDISKKNYDEGNRKSENSSVDNSKRQPTHNHYIGSHSESTTSSLGGDSKCINKLIDSDIVSPASISNLSMLLNSVHFVASPTEVYKINRSSTPNITKDAFITGYFSEELLYDSNLMDEPNISSTKELDETKDLDETVKLDSKNNSLQNETVKDMTIMIESEEMSQQYEELKLLEKSKNCSNNVILYEDGNENNNKDITILKSVSPFYHITETRESVCISNGISLRENHDNSTSIIQLQEPSSLSDDAESRSALNVAEIIEANNEEPSTSSNIKITRKRSRNSQEWCDVKNKRLKNSGESYKGARSKKTYSAKIIGPSCSCKKNCGINFAIEQRQEIFNSFYRLKDHELQWQYIDRHVQVIPIKRMTLDRKNNRTQTLKYYFFQEGSPIQVCKVFFLNTLQISEQVVFTALEKIKRDESLVDKRGTHLNRPHKMSDATKDSILKHINLFPSVESHYTRKRSKRQYLSEQLNISKMYRLYTDWFPNQEFTQVQIATKRQYETVFNTEFNFSFFKPKKDLCATCSLYEQADEVKKATLREKYQEHLLRKNRVREIKEEEKSMADNNTTVAIFDLEKVLGVPQSEVGIFHYKRKYPVYNFTIFNALNKSGHCYVWHLSIAKRGSTEIGSCLFKFIDQEVQRGINNISFYSDGCAGQNKNRYIFALYQYALKLLNVDTITHRFFETGHSQNEGDSMHSLIERSMKNKVLYTPDQVYSVIMNAKVSGNKYKLIEMEQTDFYNIKDLIVGKNWTTDSQGRKIAWNKVMQVKVSKSNPNLVNLKYNYDDEYFELNTETQIHRSRRGKRLANVDLAENTKRLKQAYTQQIGVSKALLADLISLCRIEAIPTHYHRFYQSLKSSEENQIQESHSDSDDGRDDDE